jgi:hypothetical protein
MFPQNAHSFFAWLFIQDTTATVDVKKGNEKKIKWRKKLSGF